MSDTSKKISIGYLSIPMKIQNSVRNQLISFAEVEEVRFIELNKAAPSLDRFDAIIVGWDINNTTLFDHLKKIRSVWNNRKIMFIGFAKPADWEKGIALDLGISEWVDPNHFAREIGSFEARINEHAAHLKIATDIEAKAAAAINTKNITEFKKAIDSLMFIDARNRIFVEFLGEMLSDSGLHQEAFDLYNRVLLNQPGAVRLLIRAAESLVRLNKHQEAQVFFEKADSAAKQYLEASLSLVGKKVRGGPEELNNALARVNSNDRIVQYIESRTYSINEIAGDQEALDYLKDVKRNSKIPAIKKLDYAAIMTKIEKQKHAGTITFEKKRSLAANVSESLDYSEIDTKEKIRRRKLKKSS